MEAKVKETQDPRIDPQDQDVFATEEIKIEEMAIDGICGVY